MSTNDRTAQRKADDVFDALDDYGKGQIALYGTAFTTYEDMGEDVCSWLNARARSWRAALLTRQGK